MNLIYFPMSGEKEGWNNYLNDFSFMVFSRQSTLKRRRRSFVIRSWSKIFVQVSLD